MSYDQRDRNRFSDVRDEDRYNDVDGHGARGNNRYRDEVYSKRVPAGKRTYFFDVKSTRSGDDFFVTITESKRIDEGHYEKHKIFLYKEDFGKFINAMHEVVLHIKQNHLPDYDFRNMPDLTVVPQEEDDRGHSHTDDQRDY